MSGKFKIHARYLLSVALVALPFGAALVSGSADVLAQSAKPAAKVPAKSPELNAGIAAVNAGQSKLAIAKLSSAINAKTLSGPDVARALYYRGLALGQVGRHGQAVADLTGALWLSGLSPQERQKAYAARSVSYDATGLKAQAAADRKSAGAAATAAIKAPPKPTPTTGAKKPVAVAGSAASRTSSNEAAPPSAAAQPSTPGIDPISNFFSSIFGGGQTASSEATAIDTTAKADKAPIVASSKPIEPVAAPKPVAKTAAQSATPAPAAPAKATPKGWQTNVVAAAPAAQPAAPSQSGFGSFMSALFGGTADPAPKPIEQSAPKRTRVASLETSTPAQSGPSNTARALPKGSYLLQIASVRSRSEAGTLVSNLRKKHPKVVTASNTVIDQTVIGNMGQFHRVMVGPFKTASASSKACAALQKGGQDCFTIKK